MARNVTSSYNMLHKDTIRKKQQKFTVLPSLCVSVSPLLPLIRRTWSWSDFLHPRCYFCLLTWTCCDLWPSTYLKAHSSFFSLLLHHSISAVDGCKEVKGHETLALCNSGRSGYKSLEKKENGNSKQMKEGVIFRRRKISCERRKRGKWGVKINEK